MIRIIDGTEAQVEGCLAIMKDKAAGKQFTDALASACTLSELKNLRVAVRRGMANASMTSDGIRFADGQAASRMILDAMHDKRFAHTEKEARKLEGEK